MISASLESVKFQHLVSFDAKIGGEEGGRSILETIEDEKYMSPDEVIDQEKIGIVIAKSLSKLSKREEQVMRLRFGISQDDESEEMNLTCQEIKNIQSQTE